MFPQIIIYLVEYSSKYAKNKNYYHSLVTDFIFFKWLYSQVHAGFYGRYRKIINEHKKTICGLLGYIIGRVELISATGYTNTSQDSDLYDKLFFSYDRYLLYQYR